MTRIFARAASTDRGTREVGSAVGVELQPRGDGWPNQGDVEGPATLSYDQRQRPEVLRLRDAEQRPTGARSATPRMMVEKGEKSRLWSRGGAAPLGPSAPYLSPASPAQGWTNMLEQPAGLAGLKYGGHAAGSTRGVRTWAQRRQRRWPWLRAAPVAALCRWPGREAGLGRPRRVQYDQAQHSRVFVAAHPPAPAPASLWKLDSVA